MFDVVRNGRTFDLEAVADGIAWAYKRSQAEDEMFAARNTSEDVRWSRLTCVLEDAHAGLLEMRMWDQPHAQPQGA